MMLKKMAGLFLMSLTLVSFGEVAFAHGERAQQAGLRMRTLNWWDVEVSPKKVSVNEVITIKGKFSPSEWWPKHMANPSERLAFLNIGVPGPVFVRIDSRVNGVPMIRSTHFELGETYNFEIKLKARTPGRYHMHPVLSVHDTGPIIGSGYWVEIVGDQADFENKVTTLTGEVIDMETQGMDQIITWHLFWVAVGVAWLLYWFRKLPVLMPRFKDVARLGPNHANELISMKDMVVGILFFGGVLVSIAGSYMWTQSQYPITTPLQTGEVEVEPLPNQRGIVELKMLDARYRLPGRSFKVEMEVTNNSDSPIRLGEFLTANIRFVNRDVMGDVQPVDEQDLVAKQGLVVDDNLVQPGETRKVTLRAEDALWETMRLTSLVYDPDSRFAAMLFFFDEEGNRYHVEIGGQMMPTFS